MSVAISDPLQQRRDALTRANYVRHSRANLKRDLNTRRRTIAQVLATPPEYILGMEIIDLVMVVPRYGRWRALKALREVNITPARKVGMLTERQRLELAQLLAPGATT